MYQKNLLECDNYVLPNVFLPGMLSLCIHPLSTLTTDVGLHVSVVLLRMQCQNIPMYCLIMTAVCIFGTIPLRCGVMAFLGILQLQSSVYVFLKAF
jgi:hypothetical protein